MSQGYDPQYDEETPLVKQLRERGDKAEKRAKELEEQITKLSAQVKRTSISDVLKTKNVPSAVARFIERDIEGDVTPDAVEAWLKDNGELFGIKAETEPAPQSQEPAVQDPRLAEAQAAMAGMNKAEAGAQQPVMDDATLAKLQDPNLTPKELYQLLGASDGPSYYYDYQNRS